ncbi:MAG: hypothetical protein Q4G70_02840 [Pseudomonadota bacterium]|nr:hypothetical protein [Pseudomonadota bacterium]
MYLKKINDLQNVFLRGFQKSRQRGPSERNLPLPQGEGWGEGKRRVMNYEIFNRLKGMAQKAAPIPPRRAHEFMTTIALAA